MYIWNLMLHSLLFLKLQHVVVVSMKVDPIGSYDVKLIGGMAILQKGWPFWRKCVTGGGHQMINQVHCQSTFLFSAKVDVELPYTSLALCLLAPFHASHQDENGVNSEL